MYSYVSNVAIVIPQGQLLTEVAGSAWADEDVGAALQFLEFCNAFSEVYCCITNVVTVNHHIKQGYVILL